jgi:L-ascorbate metabolism protein UlaG (beta-lactamase superfamily)
MFEYKGIKIAWLGHNGFGIESDKTIYIDPFRIGSGKKADVVFITHEHYDHCSPEDVKKIAADDTTIVTIPMAEPALKELKVKEIKLVKPGDNVEIGGVKAAVFPAYNINKFRSPGRPFHPKEDGKVSYLLNISGVRIYHAGDSDFIPEMKNLETDIALLPVSGTYVMTAKEAAEATKNMKIKLAIPMHYGSIVGSERDAEEFKRLAGCDAIILKKEEED